MKNTKILTIVLLGHCFSGLSASGKVEIYQDIQSLADVVKEINADFDSIKQSGDEFLVKHGFQMRCIANSNQFVASLCMNDTLSKNEKQKADCFTQIPQIFTQLSTIQAISDKRAREAAQAQLIQDYTDLYDTCIRSNKKLRPYNG